MNIKTVTRPTNELHIISESLSLYVKIGNAQVGGTKVRDDETGEELGKGSSEIHLGSSPNLKDKVLRVTTNILDVNPATNKVIVTYTFEKTAPEQFVFEDVVEENGDMLSLVSKYRII